MLQTFYPKATDYTFFSTTHGIFSKIKHMLGHKTSLNKFNRIGIISSVFSDHNGMKLEINHMKKTGKFKYVDIKQHRTNSQWVKEEIKKEIKKYVETNENGNVTYLWDAGKAVHSDK